MPEGWVLLDAIEYRRPGTVRPGKPTREDRRYAAFVIRPGRPIVRLDLGEADPIDAAIRDFSRLIDAPTSDYEEPARRLSALIRDPLRPHLEGAKGLLLSGDGLLHRLPLAALPGREAGDLLGRGDGLRHHPGRPLAARPPRRAPRSSGALIVGDVDYGTLPGYDRLPKTRAEADEVARPSAPRIRARPWRS